MSGIRQGLRAAVRPRAVGYGIPIGVLGATGEPVIERQDPALTESFVAAAKQLVGQGVRAITGDCAHMGTYQRAVADAVPVPVLLSSLLQVPLLLRMLAAGERLAVLVADSTTVSERLLRCVGIDEEGAARCRFKGLEDRAHFRSVTLEESGTLDVARMEAEMVATALALVDDDPSIGAFLLDCSDMPPYGAAIQRATGLPVFDWIGFVDYVHHAVVR